MKTKNVPRAVGWISAFAATVSLGLYVHANSYSDVADLRDHMKKYANESRVLQEGLRSAEIAVDAFVTPEYVVFGEPFGRGTVYTRAITIDHRVMYWAIDYHFTHDNGEWRLGDSTMYVHGPDLISNARTALNRERFAFLK
ncbi:MAG: hypothetical protein SGI88_22695 [Candidatus Hydrogenedentes bacterium]|nr:hypothetical protein [Candidatus Hydrogenedentota bacterium]